MRSPCCPASRDPATSLSFPTQTRRRDACSSRRWRSASAAPDREILAGEYEKAPPGQERLLLGHESIGRVLEAPDRVGMKPGDLVVSVVRRPDPVP
jgi:hypothetical protein